MKSPVVKRSIIIGGHKTSVSLEDAFWSDLKEIAHSQGATVSKLVAQEEPAGCPAGKRLPHRQTDQRIA
jgi:predicted DNA-binding ribbon-helix-helix protein